METKFTQGDWIKITKKTKIELPYDTEVDVMYKNGNITPAKVQGNWFSIEPKYFRIEDSIYGINKYRLK